MLNPNRIFEGEADPIGPNSHEQYAAQVAMLVADVEAEKKKLEVKIEMSKQQDD